MIEAAMSEMYLRTCASSKRTFRFAQSDQNLHWAHIGQLRMQSIFMRKTLIILHGCAGWFESSLGAHVQRYIFSRCGSYLGQCWSHGKQYTPQVVSFYERSFIMHWIVFINVCHYHWLWKSLVQIKHCLCHYFIGKRDWLLCFSLVCNVCASLFSLVICFLLWCPW